MIMEWSWHDSHVFPTREFKENLIKFFQKERMKLCKSDFLKTLPANDENIYQKFAQINVVVRNETFRLIAGNNQTK